MLSDEYARKVVSLARARSVLLRTYEAEELTTEMETAFLVGCCPCAVCGGQLFVSSRCVVASLIDPFAVGTYDWAQYTVDVLMESANEVMRQARARQGESILYVSGCTSFLNVSVLFYQSHFFVVVPCVISVAIVHSKRV
jgi:hypothetical protein